MEEVVQDPLSMKIHLLASRMDQQAHPQDKGQHLIIMATEDPIVDPHPIMKTPSTVIGLPLVGLSVVPLAEVSLEVAVAMGLPIEVVGEVGADVAVDVGDVGVAPSRIGETRQADLT